MYTLSKMYGKQLQQERNFVHVPEFEEEVIPFLDNKERKEVCGETKSLRESFGLVRESYELIDFQEKEDVDVLEKEVLCGVHNIDLHSPEFIKNTLEQLEEMSEKIDNLIQGIKNSVAAFSAAYVDYLRHCGIYPVALEKKNELSLVSSTIDVNELRKALQENGDVRLTQTVCGDVISIEVRVGFVSLGVLELLVKPLKSDSSE